MDDYETETIEGCIEEIEELFDKNYKLQEQLQQYKQQIDKLKHKIQLLQMDGQVEAKDLLTLLQILKERDEE